MSVLINPSRRSETEAEEGRLGGNYHSETTPTARQEVHSPSFDDRITQWLNQHPAPSAPGRCAWCGRPASPEAMVVPFGTEPGTHTWLHAECWGSWHAARRAQALVAVSAAPIEQAGQSAPQVASEIQAEPSVSEAVPATKLDEPNAARRGQVSEIDGRLEHFCMECGRFAPFGYGVRLRVGQLGRWYCAAHRPHGDTPCCRRRIGR
jgi:hypothetical protein